MELEIPHLDNPKFRKELVKNLTIFRRLRKVSRKKAENLFDQFVSGKKQAVIIIGQEANEDEQKYLLSQYKKIFADAKKPEFIVNPRLEWGVRMMWGDDMVELSLQWIN